MPDRSPPSERESLEKAIAAQENLRGMVNDAIIDATITTLKEKLAALKPAPPEQRKLATILFVDIAGHTALTVDLDPEEQMALVDPILERFARRVEAYGGRVARYQGDGFKAVFGLPVAHENDPQQAIRAGLAIQEEAGNIANELKETRGFPDFRVRVGISTGLVFAGGETEGEDTIKGAPVNIAARLEALAEPGTVLISHDTYRLVRGLFDFEPLDAVPIKGFEEPIAIYRVLRAKRRGFYRGTRGVEGVETRMIGREAEVIQLQKTLADVVEERDRQFITVVGEAGIGKSRLLYEFENWIDLHPDNFRLFKGRARLETQGQPYGLLRDLFASHFDIQDDDSAQTAREKLLQGLASDLGSGQGKDEHGHALGQLLGYDFSESPYLKAALANPRMLRAQALNTLDTLFRSVSDRSPTLILFEDLHWADDASLDALNQLVLEWPDLPIFILGTARPGLLERRPNWGDGQHFHRRIQLDPLSRRESRRLVEEVLKKMSSIPEDIRELVVGNAEGNPFYVEELIKLMIDDGVIVPGESAWQVHAAQLAEAHVPATLTGVLQARLDGLPAEERQILQEASVIGRVFWDNTLEHIQSSAEKDPEQEIEAVLDALRTRELVFRRETSAFAEAREYIFKHALLREVTYESVLKRVRQAYHGLVADWLIEHAGDRAGEFTALIADHLVLAGRETDAIQYLHKAGEEAAQRFANEEAVRHFQRALNLLSKQPETAERNEQELALQMSLGPPLIIVRGFGARVVGETYNRARELARLTDQFEPLFQATWGQWVYYNQLCDFETATSLLSQLFEQAELAGDNRLLLEAHHSGWSTWGVFGDHLKTQEHIEQGIALYSPELSGEHIRIYGHDPAACGYANGGMNLWLLGYPDQARTMTLDGIAHGANLDPFSKAFTEFGRGRVSIMRGDFTGELEKAEAFEELASKQDSPLFSLGADIALGVHLVRTEKAAEGVHRLLRAIQLGERIGAVGMVLFALSDFLWACLMIEKYQQGLQVVRQKLEKHPFTGQRWMESEIRRLYGELILADDPDRTKEAEAEFNLAIEISRKQHAKSLELRAATSLARLWQKQGEVQKAHQRLAEVYDWFTEGFDTADLLEAKALLDELIN